MTFTGLVSNVVRISWDQAKSILTARAESPEYWAKSVKGDSIAINGVCLTLLNETLTNEAQFFVMEETRKLTTFGLPIADNSPANAEHALRQGDSIGGHYVTGHVNCIGTVRQINIRPDGSRYFTIGVPDIEKVVYKDSISLDGTSLTITNVDTEKKEFMVSVIPHTLEHTILQYKKVGDPINVEFAIIKMSTGDSGKLTYGDSSKNSDTNSHDDVGYMEMAIRLGEKGIYTAAPNPWVGCIIVKNDKIIGQGYHHAKGFPHAEINAIQNAISDGYESQLKGSTVYVTLEPCSHQGSTPPCVNALIKIGVSRVVVAAVDPDPKVSGTGISILKANGIDVVTGILSREASESLSSYLHQRMHNRPKVILKMAMSIDGKVSCSDGSSKWITSNDSRMHAHINYRATSQAIITGSGTVISDNPSLNVRIADITGKIMYKQPLRVVLSSKDLSDGNYTIFNDGAETISWKKSFSELLIELNNRGCLQVLVEAGGTLASSLLDEDCVDELIVYQAPVILGASANSWIKCDLTNTINDAVFWNLVKVEKIGNDLCCLYRKVIKN